MTEKFKWLPYYDRVDLKSFYDFNEKMLEGVEKIQAAQDALLAKGFDALKLIGYSEQDFMLAHDNSRNKISICWRESQIGVTVRPVFEVITEWPNIESGQYYVNVKGRVVSPWPEPKVNDEVR